MTIPTGPVDKSINADLLRLEENLKPVHAGSMLGRVAKQIVEKLEEKWEKLVSFIKGNQWVSKQERAIGNLNEQLKSLNVIYSDYAEIVRENKDPTVKTEFNNFNENIKDQLEIMRRICVEVRRKMPEKVSEKAVSGVEKEIGSFLNTVREGVPTTPKKPETTGAKDDMETEIELSNRFGPLEKFGEREFSEEEVSRGRGPGKREEVSGRPKREKKPEKRGTEREFDKLWEDLGGGKEALKKAKAEEKERRDVGKGAEKEVTRTAEEELKYLEKVLGDKKQKTKKEPTTVVSQEHMSKTQRQGARNQDKVTDFTKKPEVRREDKGVKESKKEATDEEVETMLGSPKIDQPVQSKKDKTAFAKQLEERYESKSKEVAASKQRKPEKEKVEPPKVEKKEEQWQEVVGKKTKPGQGSGVEKPREEKKEVQKPKSEKVGGFGGFEDENMFAALEVEEGMEEEEVSLGRPEEKVTKEEVSTQTQPKPLSKSKQKKSDRAQQHRLEREQKELKKASAQRPAPTGVTQAQTPPEKPADLRTEASKTQTEEPQTPLEEPKKGVSKLTSEGRANIQAKTQERLAKMRGEQPKKLSSEEQAKSLKDVERSLAERRAAKAEVPQEEEFGEFQGAEQVPTPPKGTEKEMKEVPIEISGGEEAVAKRLGPQMNKLKENPKLKDTIVNEFQNIRDFKLEALNSKVKKEPNSQKEFFTALKEVSTFMEELNKSKSDDRQFVSLINKGKANIKAVYDLVGQKVPTDLFTKIDKSLT